MRVTTTHVSEGDTFLAPPRDDHGSWPFLLLHAGDATQRPTDISLTFADTATELVGVLIPGYDAIPHSSGAEGAVRGTPSDADHDEALWLRYSQAVATAELIQQHILAAAVINGDFDQAAASEDTLTTMLGGKTVVFTGEHWRWNVLLVLIDYAPFTDVPRPTGRVAYLDPSTETTYLTSLHEAGLVRFLPRQVTPRQAPRGTGRRHGDVRRPRR
jgi:hypothetical protein